MVNIAYLDWIAAVFEIVGFWMIGNKRRSGFISCMMCSILWTGVAIQSELYGLLVIAILCFILHVRGYLKWKHREEKYTLDEAKEILKKLE
jgi:nicotinamide riboside transporter PnuC